MSTSIESPGTGSISLHVPAQFRYLAIVRDAAMEICKRMQFAEFDCYKVEMAVDEACTNIIEHGYKGEVPAGLEEDHPGLTVNFMAHPDRLVVEITDHSDGLALPGLGDGGSAIVPSDTDDDQLGMYIIQRFVDTADYRRDPKLGNQLRLTKNR